jgi:ABC-type glycerol-3-phosphate transport system substrate-binding protein
VKIEPVKMMVRGLLAALLLLLAVGCGGDEPETDDPTAKVEVQLGKEFTWNDFTVSDGWALETTKQMVEMEEQDQPFITGEVTNDGDEKRFAVFEVIFVGNGNLQATIHCTSELELGPGEASPMDCPGFGQVMPKGYDLIQVQPITR